jgi:putative ABC transport system substrate-binding protein
MRRRQFIGLVGGAAAWPLAAGAQQANISKIGVLNLVNPEPFRTLLQDELRNFGYTAGQNLQLAFRSAEGNPDLLSSLAAELVGLKVDLIVCYPSPAVAAAKQATRAIPIVMLGAGDPVGTGLVASFTRPGGNITGTSATAAESGAKILEIVREIIPSTNRVTVLANADDPFTKSFVEQIELGGRTLRVEIQVVMIKREDDLEPAFASMKESATDAVMVQPSLPRKRAADLALTYRIPAIAPTGAFATLGGLAAYSSSPREMTRLTVTTIDKILKGRNPADLPVEQPTKFELIINLKTARALGIEISPILLARADEVIE